MKKKLDMKNINWKEAGKGSLFVAANFGLAVIIIACILWGLSAYLRSYTQHGIEESVPDIKGMVVEEAEKVLGLQKLKLEIIDSTYSDKVPFGTIVEQDPTPDSHVKHGRTVYVTMNASGKRQVIMPNLHDISYRQAETTLRGLGLVVDEEYDYEPSAFRDLVLDVKVDGESIEPGQKIAVGTQVRLVVGFGQGTEEVTVPGVIGMTYQQARSTLLAARLTIGAVYYDDEEETVTEDGEEIIRYVYRQTPNEGEIVIEGETVTLRLSSDIEKAATDRGDENEEFIF